jgi:hypothetical protein
MSQRVTFEEKRRYWREQVERQKASGLNMSKWCREQQIDYRHFLYWNERFSSSQLALTQATFEELKESADNAPVIIECQGMRVLVSATSDPKVLLKCLQALKGVSC